MTSRLAILALLLLVAGCESGGVPVDSGRSPPDSGLLPGTTDTVDDVTLGLAVAAALSAPLAPDGAMLRADATPDTTAHMRAQHGFSGSSVVTPSTCAAYSWSGLTATVTLTGCTLESTGMPVSGAVTLAVTVRPTTVFTVTLSGLTVGTTMFNGSATLTMNGTDAMPLPPTLDVDLTYATAAITRHLTATGLTVTTTATSMAIAGSATVGNGGVTTALVITALTWQLGQCLPSSGSIAMTTSTYPTTTVTFLATTPMDGNVMVALGSSPASTQMLFTACP